MTLSACRISTHHPHPTTCSDPSRSQPYQAPEARCALHSATITMPEAAARIGVPRAAARSTPLWVGRSGVRQPELIRATAGTVQPDAAISVPVAQCRLVDEPAASAAPLANWLTISVARGSCFAYASG